MDYLALYAKYLQKFLRIGRSLKAVCDSSDGTTGLVLKKIKNSKLQLLLINSKPDGRFPAHGPDPWKRGTAAALKRRVLETKSDFGAIFDADGDRVFFVDNRGRPVAAEAVVLLLAKDFPPPYIVDLRMGWLVKKSPLKLIESRVGHYFIKKLMKAKKVKLGVEFSGHIYFEYRFGKRTSYFDSALRGLMHFANSVSAIVSGGASLSGWLDALPEYYRSGEINFQVRNKEMLMRAIERRFRKKAIHLSRLDGLTLEFKDWWFNVRLSNTEPLLRLNVEATSKKKLYFELNSLKKLIAQAK